MQNSERHRKKFSRGFDIVLANLFRGDGSMARFHLSHINTEENTQYTSLTSNTNEGHFIQYMTPKHIDRCLLCMVFAPLLCDSEHNSDEEVYEAYQAWRRRRRETRMPRAALLHPTQSAWSFLFGCGYDPPLIAMTGFDHASFAHLEDRFTWFFNNYSPWLQHGVRGIRKLEHDRSVDPHGRPRMLDARMNLGLVLFWTRSRGANRTMELIFGLTGTPCYKWLYFGRRILIKVLIEERQAQIILPHEQDIEVYKAAIVGRHPHLRDVAFTADGVKLSLECAGDDPTENQFYNGWTHDHYVSAILLFAPDGTIPAAVYNAPGTMHDSTVADYGEMYAKLQLLWDRYRAKTVIDSAFNLEDHPFLIKSSSEDQGRDAQELLMYADATSLRQSSEWGMSGFKRSFPRLLDRLHWEETGERKVIVQLMILLYNFRSRRVGINEILNTYMPNLSVEAQLHFGTYLQYYE